MYLKFVDKDEATSVLYENDKPKYQNIDVVGTIYSPSEEVDEDGYPILVAKEGWHVNVRVVGEEDAYILSNYAVSPEQPSRVWG